ncbi:3-hydroxyacyl-CoA dehydrogenase NAD-binding domain-containing protein [Candidatus Poriferisodalis sp.]|uniref:3-hydroxyacyl-CoA dehydrogenase NAD-binding domain-containing protein n=1 Tax=Candidatus Poriferisodalis sp. TaxID=3101277 RepID=UPI003B01D8C8
MTDPCPTGHADAADGELPGSVAVVGAGVIGAAWAARWALCGVDVEVYDPLPTASRQVESTLEAARAAWERLGLLSRETGERSERAHAVALGEVILTSEVGDAVIDAVLIHECVPERVKIKQAVYAEVEAAAAPDAVIASSTSGIRPSELQAEMQHPERLVVGHPFNPVYLLPLVEVVGGSQTSELTIERAMGWFNAAGMAPLRVRSEVDGFVADRLLEALWREALWLVHDGVATVAEIDDAMRLGFGLRWAQMGVFQTYATAGGEGGFRHFIEHFGPALQQPWTKLTDVPELTPEFIATLITQSDEQSGDQPVAELCAARDRNLVDLLLALEANDWGAGRSLAALRRRMSAAG